MASLKSLGLPESFCFAPYTNLDLDQDGSVYPCYRSKESQTYWKVHHVHQNLNSAKFQKLRLDLWNGRENPNCVQCHRREKQGLQSTRQEYNEYFLNELAEDLSFVENIKKAPEFAGCEQVHTLEIRPHSLCNLACGHCDEHSSSRWIKLKGLNKEQYKYHLIDNPEYLKGFYHRASNLKTVHFTGGEPLIYASAHKEWIKGIRNKSQIELRYHTNLQHDKIHSYSHEWKEFKHVKFFVSIDVSERYYSYFRYGGRWDLLAYNIDNLKRMGHEVVGIITVNALTMLDLVPLVKFMVERDLQIHVAFVDPPHPISSVYLSNEQKQIAGEQVAEAKQLLHYEEEWKILRGLKALSKIPDFMNSEYYGDQMSDRLTDHLNSLNTMYKMNWKEL